MIKVLYEDNHLIAVLKPINVPTQKDSSNDIDMVSLVKDYLKKKYNKPGNVYLGLLHRLDRPVSGVLLFAKTSKAAERMTKDIKNHNVRKTYYAVVEGKVDKKGTFIDKDLKTVEWVLTIYDYGLRLGYVAKLSFQKQDQKFKAWVRADTSGVQVSKDKVSLKDIRQYYDHLNIWVDKFIHTGDLANILEQIHWDKLNIEVDMLDDLE